MVLHMCVSAPAHLKSWYREQISVRETVVNATLSIHTVVFSEPFNLSHSVLMISLLFSLPQLVTRVLLTASVVMPPGDEMQQNYEEINAA